MALVRIKKEYQEINNEKEAGLSAVLINDNIKHWKGTFPGPKDTPYEGGKFVVDIQIPDNYPFVPPKMRFDTKIWHPNVSSQNGAICLDILKDQWSPALTMRTALLSLQALLSCPNPDSPQDAQVAHQYKNDIEAYLRTAKYWTEIYAMPESENKRAEKVQTLVGMGFAEEQARKALEANDWDENRAIDALFAAA